MNLKINFDELPESEQNFLTMVYGSQVVSRSVYNLKKILYVKELEENEKVFFDKNNLVSTNFFIQKLYKIQGNLIPLRFNLAVNKLIENTEELRMNYCIVDDRTLKVFFEKRGEMPPIIYRNLENVPDIDLTLQNIMEADMRQNFDLQHDHLIRFSVFHTADEEYAVLITMPQPIENYFDIQNLFRDALNIETLPTESKFSLKYSPSISESIQDYWSKILNDLPKMPEIPFSKLFKGKYKQKAYYMNIPAAIMSDLREKAKSNKMMLIAIFQSAWAMLLQEYNKSQDTTFSVLIPDKSSVYLNTMPVRIKTNEESTPQNIINEQFKQILISQPYACNNFVAIQNIIQKQNKTFNYFLSFGDFLKDELFYSKTTGLPEGQFVMQNSWNAQNTMLGVYFHYTENEVKISILYNESHFVNDFGELLAKRYYIVLQQMLTDWNLDYNSFMTRLTNRLNAEPTEKEDNIAFMQNFIFKLEILQGTGTGNLQKLLKFAKLDTYFEGDRIHENEIKNNIIFVVEGKLVRSIETGDGWYNTLDIVKEKRWINENILLPSHKVKMSAEVLTEKAILLLLPLNDMETFLSREPSVEHKLFMHVLGEMEKYQKLWIQS